jgi:hypothetical protein
VHWQDRTISGCASWADFWERSKNLPNGKTGALFERLTQLYLQTAPEYQTELRHVWALSEVPSDVRKQLNLPALDEGIDLIACTRQLMKSRRRIARPGLGHRIVAGQSGRLEVAR